MTISTAVKKDAIYFHELNSPATTKVDSTMVTDIHEGLISKQKTLPPKYFYDKKGSELFDAITQLPEYYLARIETDLLRQHVKEMAELLGKNSFLLELGSGSSIKIRLLLEALQPDIYVPMDISREHLIASSQKLMQDFPWLTIHAACIDYTKPWQVPDFGPGRYNAFFPGSSIGNFDPEDALTLLKQIKTLVGHGGGILIGVDLKKDNEVLEAAYNDAQGVTADFNLNMLSHINDRLDADFDINNFKHKAKYNSEQSRIEMHLECVNDHTVCVEDNIYRFETGETIHTENSYKYSIEEFHQLAAREGFSPVQVWEDKDQLFSIHYLIVK